MLKTLTVLTLLGGSLIAHAQARATASRIAEGQVGVLFVNGNSDYARSRFNGYGIYADLDFHHGIGAEAEFHFMSDGDPAPKTNIYERTYEVGARYSRHYGRFQPYAKIMVGRGVFNYPYNFSNLAYNIGAIGGGTDIRITRRFNGRVDYEYQHWFSFSRDGNPSARTDSLTPNLLSGGVAYRF